MKTFPEYRPLDLPHFIGSERALYSPLPEPRTLHIRLYGHATRPRIRGEVVLGPACEGPPEHAHGGMIAYVLDEAMGACAWHGGHPVVARAIAVTYLRLVPLRAPLSIEAAVTRVAGANVHVRAKILAPDGQPLSAATGKFRVLKPAMLEKFTRLARKS